MSDGGHDFDRPGVSQAYVAGRALLPAAEERWRQAIARIAVGQRGSIRRIVDVGCGTGRFSVLLAELFDATVTGVDPSPAMLGEAVDSVGDRRCRFLAGSVEQLPLPAASADLAFLSMVYHHVRDWPAALASLGRVLRPGGLVVIRTPVRERLAGCLWTRFFPAALVFDQNRLPTEHAVRARFADRHFTAVGHLTVIQPMAGSGPDYVRRIAQRALSGLRAIPDADFFAGLAALSDHIAATNPGPDAWAEAIELFAFARAEPRAFAA